MIIATKAKSAHSVSSLPFVRFITLYCIALKSKKRKSVMKQKKEEIKQQPIGKNNLMRDLAEAFSVSENSDLKGISTDRMLFVKRLEVFDQDN